MSDKGHYVKSHLPAVSRVHHAARLSAKYRGDLTAVRDLHHLRQRTPGGVAWEGVGRGRRRGHGQQHIAISFFRKK